MNLLDLFKNEKDIEVHLNKDLSKSSTMRLTSNCDLIIFKTVNSLVHGLKVLNTNNISYKVLGMGANTLLPEKSDIPYIQLKFDFDKSKLDLDQKTFKVPASTRLSVLSSLAISHGLKGFEVLTGIPATIGGAIFMNAGTNLGEISEITKTVTYIDKLGNKKTHVVTESSFDYRKNNFLCEEDIIVEVELINSGKDPKVSEIITNYLELRNKSQPLKEWTCGCIFKNFKQSEELTCRAGHYIDIIGLKGFGVDQVKVSNKHANFMENSGSSTRSDILKLIKLTHDELKLQFGIDFETEVRI